MQNLKRKKEIVVNPCFMVDIVSNEEIEVIDSKPELSYDDIQKAYNEL